MVMAGVGVLHSRLHLVQAVAVAVLRKQRIDLGLVGATADRDLELRCKIWPSPLASNLLNSEDWMLDPLWV
jgi:hypothetical protein